MSATKGDLKKGIKVKPSIVKYWPVFICYLALWIFYGYRNSIDNSLKSDFWVSFDASFLEDLIFFGVLGFVVFIYSALRPEDHGFSTRVHAIANSRIASSDSKDYLVDVIKDHLAYNKTVKYQVDIEEISIEKGYIKLRVDTVSLICTQCSDVPWPINDLDVKLFPNYFKEDGEGGRVTYFALKNEQFPQYNRVIIDKKDKIIKKGDSPIESGFILDNFQEYEIKENTQVNFELSFEIYGLLTDDREAPFNWCVFPNKRYSSKFSITITNSTNHQIGIEYALKNKQHLEEKTPVGNFALNFKEEKVITEVGLEPEREMAIFFQVKS